MGDPVRTAGCPLSVYDPCHLSGRIVIEPMSLFGTFETCWHVRFVVAIRGKADIGKAVLNIITRSRNLPTAGRLPTA
jgi:hypothetical protein